MVYAGYDDKTVVAGKAHSETGSGYLCRGERHSYGVGSALELECTPGPQ